MDEKKFPCPVDYDINNCSSQEYGLTCDTCFYMDNKELFKREYICEWGISEEDNKAYALWVDYNYQCERYDQFVCTGGVDKYGFAKPASGYEFQVINKYATSLRDDLRSKAKLYNLSSENLKKAKKDTERLSWIGLQREYDRLFRKEK